VREGGAVRINENRNIKKLLREEKRAHHPRPPAPGGDKIQCEPFEKEDGAVNSSGVDSHLPLQKGSAQFNVVSNLGWL